MKIDQFYTDAAAGKLPSVSFVDPGFDTQSEETRRTSARARTSRPRSSTR